MKVLLFVIVFTINPLPPESQLMAALDSFYQLQIESDLAELNIKQKKKWLKYLPTVGVTYTLEGKPRPAISWSSALLYSSQKEKAQIIAKKQSIYKKNQLALEKDKLRLKGLLRKYQFLEQDIAFRQDLFEYDQQLYEIKKDRANKIEIPPSELLKGYSSLKEKGIRYFSKTKRTPRTRNSNINYRKIFLMKNKIPHQQKYQDSHISQKNLHQIWWRLHDKLESDPQLWKEQTSLKEFCTLLKTNQKYFSQTVGQATGGTILNLIHCYRINDFLRKIRKWRS